MTKDHMSLPDYDHEPVSWGSCKAVQTKCWSIQKWVLGGIATLFLFGFVTIVSSHLILADAVNTTQRDTSIVAAQLRTNDAVRGVQMEQLIDTEKKILVILTHDETSAINSKSKTN